MSHKNAFSALQDEQIEPDGNIKKSNKPKKTGKSQHGPDHIEFRIEVDTDTKTKKKTTPNKKPEKSKPVTPSISNETIKSKPVTKPTKPALTEEEIEQKFSDTLDRVKTICREGFVSGHIGFYICSLIAEAPLKSKKSWTNELNQLLVFYDTNKGILKDHKLSFDFTEKLYKFASEKEAKKK